MNLLLVDYYGNALPLAVRAAQAGHVVRWFGCKAVPDVGTGFDNVERVANWLGHTSWADLIVSGGDCMYVTQFDALRREGALVFGPSRESAALEMNWAIGAQAFINVGAPAPEFHVFDNSNRAIEYVLQNPNNYVLRYAGRTFRARNAFSAVFYLEAQPSAEQVVLQRIPNGTEATIGRFMGSQGWVGPWHEAIANHQLTVDGVVSHFTAASDIGGKFLEPMGRWLIDAGHTGFVGMNVIVGDAGSMYPIDWVCGMQWPAMCSIMSAMGGDPVRWMLDSMYGFDTTDFKCAVGVSAPLRLHHYDEFNRPIHGITRGNARHVYPNNVRAMPHKKEWYAIGPDVAVVTGQGSDVEQAITRAYKTASQLQVPGVHSLVTERPASVKRPQLH